MITKFESIGDFVSNIEFKRTSDNNLEVEIIHLNPYTSQEPHVVELTEDNLFSLIGQLLRIQSEIKKEAYNG